ncbi:Hypothetical predicted protein [Paramuricea clavata]|uniref:Uncharacterized protein n=1 Tax=Paramuricea clavata TaxID=317549 RepID=A0A6S7G6J9_PARCT|nr:Hypothetical predicted protein [Paramuricea clavata]
MSPTYPTVDITTKTPPHCSICSHPTLGYGRHGKSQVDCPICSMKVCTPSDIVLATGILILHQKPEQKHHIKSHNLRINIQLATMSSQFNNKSSYVSNSCLNT